MTTTPRQIREAIVTIVQGLTPATEAGVLFAQHRHEELDLRAWAEKYPEACMRVFEIRDTGERVLPEVSNEDVESEERLYEMVIAYPTSNRWGSALERDDVIDEDSTLVNHHAGTNSYGDITDATMITEDISREDGSPATFAVITLRAVFYRATP